MLFLSRTFNYFMVSAQELSFKRAAKKLYITPSPLGKIIGSLENSLGYQLFYRHTNGIELTQKGKELYKTLLPIYNEVEKFELRLKSDLTLNHTKGIRISTNKYYFSCLSNIIEKALCKRKKLFRVDVCDNMDVERLIKNCTIDVFLSTERLQCDNVIMTEVELPKERMKLAYSGDRGREFGDITEVVKNATWVQLHHSENIPYYNELNNYLSLNGARNEIISLPDLTQVMSLVSQGLAVSLIPESVEKEPLWKRCGIKFDFLPDSTMYTNRYAYYLEERTAEFNTLIDDIRNTLTIAK